MAVTLNITEDQAKALNWLIGSLNAGVTDDIGLTPLYTALVDHFDFVEVDNVERSIYGCWERTDNSVPATIHKSSKDVTINTLWVSA